jgi:signal transduction histidine kinase
MIAGEIVLVGKESRLLSVAYDITKQKKIERMKGEFISTVSHELRTPLTSMKGSLSLLEQGIRSRPRHSGQLPRENFWPLYSSRLIRHPPEGRHRTGTKHLQIHY